jgi:hypothetical protein
VEVLLLGVLLPVEFLLVVLLLGVLLPAEFLLVVVFRTEVHLTRAGLRQVD